MTDKREYIIQVLREKKYRITNQRKIILDVILEEEFASCKEICYKASKIDPSIGTATIYRMINTLEEIGVVTRGVKCCDFPIESDIDRLMENGLL